ncbi:hypothetical protein [Caballeronia fortuita]|uniref:hypothetical protein n=1 Tax=Caballeronia fortuita TaxID=1777138 RepID=UPI001428A5EB|nr:hypothetical protein [Caballeronia fortuita]
MSGLADTILVVMMSAARTFISFMKDSDVLGRELTPAAPLIVETRGAVIFASGAEINDTTESPAQHDAIFPCSQSRRIKFLKCGAPYQERVSGLFGDEETVSVNLTK